MCQNFKIVNYFFTPKKMIDENYIYKSGFNYNNIYLFFAEQN